MDFKSLEEITQRGADALCEDGESDRIARFAKGSYDAFVASGRTAEEVQAMMLQLLFGYDEHARVAASVLVIASGQRARAEVAAALKERDENV